MVLFINKYGQHYCIVCYVADPDELSINITPSQTQPHINQSFSLTCTVVKATGLSGTPTIEWYDAVGNLLISTKSQGML